MAVEPSIAEVEAIISNWTPAAKEKLAQKFKSATSVDRQIWYCARGRKCDGEPHEGVPYRHARGKQWPPVGSDWLVWLAMMGRGYGKTRSGAEWTLKISEKVERIALVGRRGKDVRNTMVEGVSGLRSVCEAKGLSYDWMPSKMEFTFANGSVAYGFSAEEPASLRGPEHGAAWLDEPAHMDLIDDVWDNLLFGLRLKGMPGGAKILCTSTPLPSKWLKGLIAEKTTRKVTGSTYENLANLDETFKKNVIAKYEGTRLGKQELHGSLLEDVPGALWKQALILRPTLPIEIADFTRIVVAVDPAGSNNRKSDETGIVVVGIHNGYCYVLEDKSGKYSPNGWATEANNCYIRWQADAIIAEKNFGGDMVRTTIESTKTRARIIVKTAVRGKQLRAEPVVALYEQGRVFHQGQGLVDLEEEMLTWVPGVGDSPNRVDALVWAIEDLTKGGTVGKIGRATGLIAPRTPGSGSATALRSGGNSTRFALPENFPIRRRM